MKGQDAAPKGLVRVDRGEGTYRRFIQGDRSAFDEIMDAYRDKLIFFITGYVGNAETAQDFLAFLTSAEAAEVFSAVGFTPLG